MVSGIGAEERDGPRLMAPKYKYWVLSSRHRRVQGPENPQQVLSLLIL